MAFLAKSLLSNADKVAMGKMPSLYGFDSARVCNTVEVRSRVGEMGRPAIGSQAAHPRRGAADRQQYRQAAEVASEMKQALNQRLIECARHSRIVTRKI